MRKYIYNHINEDTAYEVGDYPWGFRLRTKQRYWIETSEKKNGGQRIAIQTLNPKTGIWCKPKKSTYDLVKILFINEEGHVKTESISSYGMGEKWKDNVKSFVERHSIKLTEFQKTKIEIAYAQNEVMKGLKWEIKPSKFGSIDIFSNDPKEKEKMKMMVKEEDENKRMQEKEERKINYAVHNVYKELNLFN